MQYKKFKRQPEEVRAPATSVLIDNVLTADGLTMAILARRLNRSHSTIRAFMKNDSIQTAVLWEMCHALKRNLFADIAAMLPEYYASAALAAKDAELEAVKKERDLLLRAIGGRG